MVYLWNRTGTSYNINNTSNSGVFLNDLPVATNFNTGITEDIVYSSATATQTPSQIGTAYTVNSITILDGFTTTLSIPSSGATNPQLTITGYVLANNNTQNTSLGNYTGTGTFFNIEFAGNDVNFDVNMPSVSSSKYLYLDDPIAGTARTCPKPGREPSSSTNIRAIGPAMPMASRFISIREPSARAATATMTRTCISSVLALSIAKLPTPAPSPPPGVSNEGNSTATTRLSPMSSSLAEQVSLLSEVPRASVLRPPLRGFLPRKRPPCRQFHYHALPQRNGWRDLQPGRIWLYQVRQCEPYAHQYQHLRWADDYQHRHRLSMARFSCANLALTVNSGGSVEFEYVNPTVSNISLNLTPTTVTRFASAAINGGTLIANGSSSGNSNDVVTGALTLGAGQSTITANAASGTNTTITFGSSANTGGTALFRGSSLGGQEVGIGSGTSNIIFQTAPGISGGGGALASTTTSILPWAVGDANPTTGTGTDFVTYGANGVQLLTTYADQPTLNGANGLVNFKLTGPASLTSNAAINSLILTTGSSVEGANNLSVQSGAILATDNSDIGGTTPGSLNFGNSQGIITVDATKTLTIGSPVANVNNVTKSGTGTLALTANNTGLIGSVTLDSGVLNFAASSLGTASIIFNGGTPNGVPATSQTSRPKRAAHQHGPDRYEWQQCGSSPPPFPDAVASTAGLNKNTGPAR